MVLKIMSRHSSGWAALYHKGGSMKHYIPLHYHNLRPHFLPTPTRNLSLFLFSIHSRSYGHGSASYCAMRFRMEKYICHAPVSDHISGHIHATTGHGPLNLDSQTDVKRKTHTRGPIVSLLHCNLSLDERVFIELSQSIDSRTSLHRSFS